MLKTEFSYQPNVCPTWEIGNMEIKQKKERDLINPFYCRCRNIKCGRKINLRNYTFLKGLKNVPASIVYTIFELFTNEGLNTVE